MDQEAVLDLFRRRARCSKATSSLSSGLHSERLPAVRAGAAASGRAPTRLGRRASGAHRGHLQPTAVLSPALGGIVIGHEVARALGVRAIFAERQDGALTLRRGFQLGRGDRVLVVEDVVTTGGSTRETIEVARAAGASVVAAAASSIDRSGAIDLGVPFAALATLTVPAYEPADCPLCAAGAPVMKPGSRA